MSPSILGYKNFYPQLHPSVWVAPTAIVIGDVEIGEKSSVWFQSVVRGDVNSIRIGSHTNIQDLSMLHVTNKQSPKPASLVIGNHVTVGHRVILHGCTIEDHCLVGMGSIIMDRVVVGAGSIVGAGSLLVEGTIVPPGCLVMGSPGKVIRPLKDPELAMIKFLPEHYARLAMDYSLGGV